MREIKFRAWAHGKMFEWDNMMARYNQSLAREAFEGYEAIMQYTGLLDKNGVEIYESDIVTWCINGKEETGTVVFDTGRFWIENFWNDWLRGEYEVIGNIYSTPDLLEQSNV